jgi:hypothetical protein
VFSAKLPVKEPHTDHFRRLELGEGPIQSVSAISLGVLTAPVLNPRLDGEESYRAFTNPVWVIPVDIRCRVDHTRVSDNTIKAGGLVVAFTFDLSMSGHQEEVRLDSLGPDGLSRMIEGNVLSPVIAGDSPQGWKSADVPNIGRVRHAEYAVMNTQPIDLHVAQLERRFIVYIKHPKDMNGNQLNSVARSFVLPDDCIAP